MRQSAVPSSVSAIIVAAGVVAYQVPACADEAATTLLNNTLSVSLGTFVLGTDTKVALNGSGGTAGTVVDLERDLQFADTNRFRVDGTWRFASRHKLRVMYFDARQSRDATISRDLTIGDTTYPVDSQLHAENSFKIAELAYEYAFWRGANYEVTASAGIHGVQFKFAVSGMGTVNGMPGQFRAESASTTAPLPVVGMHGLWQFQPQWYLDAQAQYFALKVNAIDGHVSDLRAGVVRMLGAHFGIGAGWNQFITRVSIDKSGFDGSLRWRYSGAMLYVTGAL